MQPYEFRRLTIHYRNSGGKREEVENVFIGHEHRLHSMKTTSDVNKFIDGLGGDGWQIVAATFDFERSIEYIVFQKPIIYP